jgi:hypothetical protein
MPSTSDSFPASARGTYRPDDDFIRDSPTDHMKGWNNAVQDALQQFNRPPRDSVYQVTFVLSATVVETDNPGRISEYIATGI